MSSPLKTLKSVCSIILSSIKHLLLLTMVVSGFWAATGASANQSNNKTPSIEKAKLDVEVKQDSKKLESQKDDDALGSYTLEDGARLGAYGDGIYGN